MGSVSYEVMPNSGNSNTKRKINSALARTVPALLVIGIIGYLIFVDPFGLFITEETPVTESPLAVVEERLTNSILNVETQLSLDIKNKVDSLTEQSTKLEAALQEKLKTGLDEAEKKILESIGQSENVKDLIRAELKIQLAEVFTKLDELTAKLEKLEAKQSVATEEKNPSTGDVKADKPKKENPSEAVEPLITGAEAAAEAIVDEKQADAVENKEELKFEVPETQQ